MRLAKIALCMALIFAVTCGDDDDDMVNPDAPPPPDASVGQPDAPMSVPDAAVNTPDAAVGTPDAAVGPPDAAAGTPDAAVGTPDAAVGTPDAAVGTPDAAVGTPDAAVGTPDAAVGTPDAAVGTPDAAPALLCPTMESCVDLTGGGDLGCLEGGTSIPAGNQTGCDVGGCDGNFGCWCLDMACTGTTAVCIERCGACTAGHTCTDLTGGGAYGCLEGGGIPAGNQTGCDVGGCDGNYTCWCLDVACTGVTAGCIENCTTP